MIARNFCYNVDDVAQGLVTKENWSLHITCIFLRSFSSSEKQLYEMIKFDIIEVTWHRKQELKHAYLCFVFQGTEGAIPRCKPFKYTYEKEIVMYVNRLIVS